MGLTAQKYCSFPIASITKADDDGDIQVVGRCSDGQVDHDGDIVSPKFMASAVKDWLATYPAVRYQHRGDHPAGKGLDAWQDADGSTFLKALICDDAAKRMVRKGVLRAFSVGLSDPQTRESARCPRWEIVGGRLTEVSIVDAPSNARCGIEIIGKSASGVPEFSGRAWDMAGKAGKAERHLRKAAKLLGVNPDGLGDVPPGVFKSRELEAAMVALSAEKALRGWMREALDSADPWKREMAWQVLHGQG